MASTLWMEDGVLTKYQKSIVEVVRRRYRYRFLSLDQVGFLFCAPLVTSSMLEVGLWAVFCATGTTSASLPIPYTPRSKLPQASVLSQATAEASRARVSPRRAIPCLVDGRKVKRMGPVPADGPRRWYPVCLSACCGQRKGLIPLFSLLPRVL